MTGALVHAQAARQLSPHRINPLLAASLAHSPVNTGHCTSVYVQHKYNYSTQYICTDRYGFKIFTNISLMYVQYTPYVAISVQSEAIFPISSC
jgi:hypothetical protein